MDIFSIFTLAGGVAVFLFGMNLMGDGLQSAASGKMQSLLARLTSNLFKSVLLGAIVTAVIQSSSATTVMVVGLVNAGIMNLSQAVGVIMGANVGTTITAWLLSLTSIQGDSFFLKLANPSGFAPILAVIGIILFLVSKKDRSKAIGHILIGFAILMLGMQVMSGAVAPLKDSPRFAELFLKFENPILGVLIGTILTAIVQSSSASVGILQALAATGQVSWAAAIPIIMGQNIGTCITAMLAGIGAKKNAKRAAVIHLLFNFIGSVGFLLIFYSINLIRPFSLLSDSVTAPGIAAFHTFFNLIVTGALLPFHKLLVKLSVKLIKDRPEDIDQEAVLDDEKAEVLYVLDNRFLDSPSFALEKAEEALFTMAELSQEAILTSLEMLDKPTAKKLNRVVRKENIVDKFEDRLQTYLLHLSQRELGDKDTIKLNIMMHTINDLERMSDHAVNVAEAFIKQEQQEGEFSDEARLELKIFMAAIKEIVGLTVMYAKDPRANRSEEIEALEEVIDNLNVEMHDRHIQRLKNQCCTVELGFTYSDILAALERIADHCANIAFYVHDVADGDYDRHEYKQRIITDSDEFRRYYETYAGKYALPDTIEGVPSENPVCSVN